ncbi:hypothetical protein XU18_3109 [Perkinsela sp. CCAP 1560/4]|nr:hypothetical protein XU18_3109 [Perkinsela sp. CCAP 1560/4]|eukprot:KNH05947.1 hypothetical protein XU18_3109 [Perkinsela sp. CCAP 1560/4]
MRGRPTKGVNIARRQRRAQKNAAKVVRMSRRIQEGARSPFVDLERSTAGAEDSNETPMERFRRLTQSSAPDNSSSVSTNHAADANRRNLSLVETPDDAVERFKNAVRANRNTLLTPSFGIENSPMELVTAHILESIQRKHTAQHQTDQRIHRGDDVLVPDSGFTSTSVLLLLPSRNLAQRYIRKLVKEFEVVEKLDEFESDFGPSEPEDPKFAQKPEDYRVLFEGNVDDRFCIGIKLHRRRAVLYSEYKQSDILVASPLGLAHYIGLGESQKAESAPSVDRSYLLASIEILCVPMLEVFLMQNWGRLKSAIDDVNAPVELRDTSELGDFTRLKPHFAEGTGKVHRQNIFTSLFPHPYFRSLFRHVCASSQLAESPEEINESQRIPSALEGLQCRVRQYFLRVPAESGVANAHQERLTYFTEKLYRTRLTYYFATRTPMLVIVPTYYQYVGVRAFFEENISESYSDLCEYTSDTDRRRALRNFNTQQVHVLLTTERYYFYKRHFIKGAAVIVWYAPPVFPQFYLENIHAINTSSESSCVITLFSQYDADALVRIVGEERTGLFLQPSSASDVFFVH